MLDIADTIYMTVNVNVTVLCRQGSYREGFSIGQGSSHT